MGKGPVWPSASLTALPPSPTASQGCFCWLCHFQMWRLRACYLAAQLLDLGRGGAGGRRQRKRPLLLGEQLGLLACAVSRNELGRSFWTKCWPCHVQQDDLQGPQTCPSSHTPGTAGAPTELTVRTSAAPLGFGQCGLDGQPWEPCPREPTTNFQSLAWKN